MTLIGALPALGAGEADYSGEPVKLGGVLLPGQVLGGDVTLARDNRFEPRFWPGVNLGSTIPGHRPGEVAATREMYDRWLVDMGELGVRLLRIYTILRPQFYEALDAYNRAHPGVPIRVLHGVWIAEEELSAARDLYAPEVVRGFRKELADAVAVIHGDATLPMRAGHAGGRYRTDVSRWILGWSIGVEWDPTTTLASDTKNAGRTPFQGRYFTASAHATPTESWIASMLDHVATLETARGWSRPMTFTNWITVDPLRHPEEPQFDEDLVSVDAAHISATPAWPGGFFASYHCYPYYPDFLRFEPGLFTALAPDGTPDPYRGLIRALRAHHAGQALMITELGVPSSIGAAHRGPRGRDQGGHSEKQAARHNAEMLGILREEGTAGGLLFEWLDEWFKFTWNTIDYELPGNRRQLWRNPLTNEEHFGIVATEPGRAPVALLDGTDAEWRDGQSRVIARRANGPVREVRATHDAEYVHLRLKLAAPSRWMTEPTRHGFDVLPGGNLGLPGLPGVDPSAEVAIRVGPGRQASLMQATWTDPMSFRWGPPANPADLLPGSGAWVTPRLVLNEPLHLPGSDGLQPAELVDVGSLKWGTADPASPRFDDRNLVIGRGTVLELRIPWSYLTFSDPSRHLHYVPLPNGQVRAVRVARPVGISVVSGRALLKTQGYQWSGWERVEFHERRKAGWGILKAAFSRLARPLAVAQAP